MESLHVINESTYTYPKIPSPPPPTVHPPVPTAPLSVEESTYRGRASGLAGYAIYQDEVEQQKYAERHLRRPRDRSPDSTLYDPEDYVLVARFRDPLLHSYLGNNEPPCDVDESSLRTNLTVLRRELSNTTLARKSTKSFKELQRLRRVQRLLEDLQDDYDAVLSPVRLLPPEILTLIFSMARELRRRLEWQLDRTEDEWMERGEDISPVGRRPEIFLEWRQVIGLIGCTRVCRRWRAAALNKPSLWTIFSINFEQLAVEDKFLRDPVEIVKMVLGRTRGYPLNFTFIAPSYYPYSCEEEFRLLCAEIRRWEEVTLDLKTELFPALDEIPSKALRVSPLHSLSIPIENPALIPALSRFVFGATNLTSLEFDWEHARRCFVSELGLPWDRLTKLRIPLRSCDLPELLALTPKLQQLEYTHITDRNRPHRVYQSNLDSNDSPDDDQEWRFPHKSLESLIIARSYGPILTNISLPALRKLVLCPVIWPAEKTLSSVASFLQTTHYQPSQASNLEELWILDIEGSSHPELLSRLLKSASDCSLLKTLSLSFRQLSSGYALQLIDVLTIQPGGVGALPSLPWLEQLKLKVFGGAEGVLLGLMDEFKDMIRSRTRFRGFRLQDTLSAQSSVKPLNLLEVLIVRDIYQEPNLQVREIERLRKELESDLGNDQLDVIVKQLC
ncbi:hypothetical protein D9758_015367 [Tetrapyrgos nigripes]|uniref:F-box domain-containing protein n=1 Tax=Tetrapyrgos nigripes TaxID=182062 RepID=A0A8H5CBB1_9AGAR|nr:hypothetical protein D9758_015367 [Tetrapyrgos nigripes]